MCRSTNRQAEPEVYFRVVHAAQNGHNDAPVATYREQTIEIALGPKEPKTPRVVELLRKAIEWKALLESGRIANQADIARHEGITRPRVTQVMGLLRLAPQIQEQLRSMPDADHRPQISERMLRPITAITDHHDQNPEFQKLLG